MSQGLRIQDGRLMNSKPVCKCPQGRSRERWMDNLKRELKELEVSTEWLRVDRIGYAPLQI